MARASNREKILTEGMRVVHAHGFGGASVRDIVQAAGVPQGSFTNHFASKEAFGLEVIDLYFANSCESMRQTLLNDELSPLQRLGDYLDASKGRLMRNNMRTGCLFGNFTAEASGDNEVIRAKLLEVFGEVQRSLAYCLRAAVKAGELRKDFDCEETASFIVASMQGANLIAKAQRDPAPVERFKKILFSTILR
jgi:TetR/AcrR family transcriptional regulator, transcriptional repressor for nem operon